MKTSTRPKPRTTAPATIVVTQWASYWGCPVVIKIDDVEFERYPESHGDAIHINEVAKRFCDEHNSK